MSFIAYLCWLLGVSAPTDCDSNSYEGWLIDACPTAVDEGNVDTAPKDDGHTRRPSQQRTNIDVSI